MILDECKCIAKAKEVVRHITEDLEFSCDNWDEPSKEKFEHLESSFKKVYYVCKNLFKKKTIGQLWLKQEKKISSLLFNTTIFFAA